MLRNECDYDQTIKITGRPDFKMSQQPVNPSDTISPLARLFQIGREQGYLTYDEILAEIPQPEQTLDQLERLFSALLAAEIPFGDEGSQQLKKSG